ncbi:hypothetical protein ZYGR_0A04480 [Zygosaccharomyces rouxii]|uniref:Sodium/calcium exchanger membrane region domain-containing protein n=1 Tax=Zygosaccharomyces rouxii TaxID=4956 RepID=A0A1Q2ZTN8_ZYGRO|nr:hypothetical protein ZYGR_0A04480 [Zygosaccharomyces rouxii]
MRLYQRCIVAAFFYSINAILIILSLKSERLWQFYVEPIGLFGCFVMLGSIASDFLTPSLSQISRDILHVSDRVSGFTLLAMGNAIPDITGTYQAMNAGAITLAIGELLGGIFFLLTVVLGSMALIKTIELKPMDRLSCNLESLAEPLSVDESGSVAYNRQLFVQDMSIFAGLILLSIYFLCDGTLMLWECAVMVLAYCAYATFLVLDHKRDNLLPSSPVVSAQRENSDAMADITTIVSNVEVPEISRRGNIHMFNEGIRERRANIRRRIRQYLRVNYNRWIRIRLRDFLDIWENETLLKNQQVAAADICSDIESEFDQDTIPPLVARRRASSWQEGDISADLPVISHPPPETQSSEGSVHYSGPQENDQLLSVPQKRPVCSKSLSCDHLPDLRPLYYTLTPVGQSDEQHVVVMESQAVEGSPKTFKSWLQRFKLYGYLTDANAFVPTSEFILLLFTTPLTIWLTILVPVMPQDKQDKPHHILDVIRFSLVPAISSLLLAEECPLSVLLLCSILFIILSFRWYKGIINWNINLRAIAGFVLSLSATSFNVHLVVNILMKWGEKFNISNTILGLTVFAWGNSFGDLVSNIVFMEIGVLDIALGACFGSPLLYFLLGIGVDGIILMLGSHKGCEKSLIKCGIDFQVDSHLSLSAIGVLVSFIILGIVVPINGWRIDKKISITLLVLYIFITGLNIYIEVI